jgi:hypothetical protein
MVAATRSIYFDPQWVEWADAWLSGGDRSAPSAERMLRRIRNLQRPERPSDRSEGVRCGLRELGDLVAKLPSGIALAVTLAAADVAGNPENSQAALDAAEAMIRSFDYLKRLHVRKVAEFSDG